MSHKLVIAAVVVGAGMALLGGVGLPLMRGTEPVGPIGCSILVLLGVFFSFVVYGMGKRRG